MLVLSSISRWLAALIVSLIGVAIASLGSPSVNADVGTQLRDGALEGAEYRRDVPLTLSADMSCDNIAGIPELTEKSVRKAGGS